MNIYAKEGHKIIVTESSINDGYKLDKEQVEKYLKVGEIYTVAFTIVHDFYTDVFIKEVPSIKFNSVNFEDFDEVNKENKENSEDDGNDEQLLYTRKDVVDIIIKYSNEIEFKYNKPSPDEIALRTGWIEENIKKDDSFKNASSNIGLLDID